MQMPTQETVGTGRNEYYETSQYGSTAMPDSMWNPMYYTGMNANHGGDPALSLGLGE